MAGLRAVKVGPDNDSLRNPDADIVISALIGWQGGVGECLKMAEFRHFPLRVRPETS